VNVYVRNMTEYGVSACLYRYAVLDLSNYTLNSGVAG